MSVSSASIPARIMAKAAQIRLAVFDVDGVMTDGRLYLGNDGNEYKSFYVRDGHGLVMLRDSGCEIAVVTARSSAALAERMQSLGIRHVYQGQQDKAQSMQQLLHSTGLEKKEVCYTGDDLIDLPAMRYAGLRIAVADADLRVRQQVDWVTAEMGGCGAVRAVCELLLHAQGKLARLQELNISPPTMLASKGEQ